jgi:hypothetical protein
MEIDEQLKSVLLKLKKLGGRVTGSLARNEQHSGSDIDIQIPDDPEGEKWNAAKDALRATGWKLLDGGIGGGVGSKESSTMIDIGRTFYKTPKEKKVESVWLSGIQFKTW